MAQKDKNNSKIKFQGVFPAIITPFKKDESVDYDALGKLIEFQIKNGVAGIVPCGTTGESPTLDHKEHAEVIKFTIDKVNGRRLVIAGTGSNCTKEAIELSRHAENDGADAILLVNPYYNKPTQEGLYRHFKAIANAIKIPVIIYNIKGRTAVNVETPTLMRIASECRNVIGVKEASGDMNQIRDVIAKRPAGFSVLSGDDNFTLELVKSGGNGVISVAANVMPVQMVKLVDLALAGKIEEAEALNKNISPMFSAEFIETNPIPIKFMVARMGMCEEVYRLPMCEMSAEHKAQVLQVMKDLKILK
ncbi:MAG: 4-hydroxy-tetrahydrodipicolinate synthase [Candidatus Diapherotrites archaeon]|nr:4-hydroxy-tetrahydrodipicolinate synthase [Candidatus Diapherotrites archaeon]